MFDTSFCDVKITIEDCNSLKAIIKGKKHWTLIKPDDKAITVTIQKSTRFLGSIAIHALSL
jgi:hypothetical protein